MDGVLHFSATTVLVVTPGIGRSIILQEDVIQHRYLCIQISDLEEVISYRDNVPDFDE